MMLQPSPLLFLGALLNFLRVGAQDTPVSKVVTLLQNLEAQVVQDGTTEATNYDAFACFCKSTTGTKSTSITTGRDTINSLSASIQDDTASKEEKSSELDGRKKDDETMKAELAAAKAVYEQAKVEYEARSADLTKALSSLQNAITAMQDSKPASFLAIRQSVEQSLALADALNLIAEPKKKILTSFLQGKTAVDPTDPTYKYHSQGIIDILTKLQGEFTAEKAEVDSEWTKTDATHQSYVQSQDAKILANEQAITTLEGEILALTGTIASNRESLVTSEGLLQDDQLYLKDLTQRCEDRARDWDQRSQLRADELAALRQALDILTNQIQGRDLAVNNRTLFLEKGASAPKAVAKIASKMARVSKHMQNPSFLQESLVGSHSRLRGAHAAALSTQARQQRVLALLQKEGRRLQSSTLSSLAVRVAEDPFTKVKGLIQRLIERLLAESTAEATKKGFCDEQLGKATVDRDSRLSDVQALDLELKELELKSDELTAEIALLTDQVTKLTDDLNNATAIRAAEKEENTRTVSTAKEGLAATKEAILILKVFYKRAAKATVLLAASPVDEDTTGAGFTGAYTGKQESSKGVIGLLEVIESDFDRTVRMTEAAEKQAAEEFVKFDRVSRSDISGKNTKISLDQEDLEKVTNTIEQKYSELATQQSLLDDALKIFEGLKPTCIDSGMSYADRVAKREEEIAALNSALCMLDTDGVEASCA